MKIFIKFLSFIERHFQMVDESFKVNTYKRAMGIPTNIEIDVKKLKVFIPMVEDSDYKILNDMLAEINKIKIRNDKMKKKYNIK